MIKRVMLSVAMLLTVGGGASAQSGIGPQPVYLGNAGTFAILTKAGITDVFESSVKGDIGWHTFRHSYRSWLDDTGAPLTVQKELMRHASIQTTMNIYGKAMTDTKRQAHTKVVELVLRKSVKSEENVGQTKPKAVIGS